MPNRMTYPINWKIRLNPISFFRLIRLHACFVVVVVSSSLSLHSCETFQYVSSFIFYDLSLFAICLHGAARCGHSESGKSFDEEWFCSWKRQNSRERLYLFGLIRKRFPGLKNRFWSLINKIRKKREHFKWISKINAHSILIFW